MRTFDTDSPDEIRDAQIAEQHTQEYMRRGKDIETREMLVTGEAFVTTLADVRAVRDRALAAQAERLRAFEEAARELVEAHDRIGAAGNTAEVNSACGAQLQAFAKLRALLEAK